MGQARQIARARGGLALAPTGLASFRFCRCMPRLQSAKPVRRVKWIFDYLRRPSWGEMPSSGRYRPRGILVVAERSRRRHFPRQSGDCWAEPAIWRMDALGTRVSVVLLGDDL